MSLNYKETSKSTAIDFAVAIGDYNYKGSYKYDASGAITSFYGSIWNNDKTVGSFSRSDTGQLSVNNIDTSEDIVAQSTNAKSVVDYIVALVKTATTSTT
jgi:hypothetical protein